MLKIKAQIASKTPRASRALKRALDPGRKGLRAHDMRVHAHNLLRPPPKKNPGSAPVYYKSHLEEM